MEFVKNTLLSKLIYYNINNTNYYYSNCRKR